MKSLIVALLLATVTSPAFAARSYKHKDSYNSGYSSTPSKGYIGLAAGKNTIVADASYSYTTTTASSIFGGYSFNNFIAAEAAYSSLGKADTSPASTYTVAGRVASLSAVAYLPIGKVFSIFGRVGYAQSNIDIVDSSTSITTSQTNSGAIYGAGALFNLGQRMGIRLAYERFNVGSATAVGSSSLTAGVLFKF